MKFSEETLMAYADGQLDLQTRAAIDAAMATDPELARRVERHRGLAESIRAAFDPVLDEPVPQRLLNAVAAESPIEEKKPGAAVIDLAARRRMKTKPPVRRWSWPQWGAIAAGVIAGVAAGRFGIPDAEQQFAMTNGALVARGNLAQALSTQLASAQPADAPIRIGISFRAKNGGYCRTFAIMKGTAGLACKSDGDWHLQVLAPSGAAPVVDGYRMAAGDLPPAITREVDSLIEGGTLDAGAEESARQQAWRK